MPNQAQSSNFKVLIFGFWILFGFYQGSVALGATPDELRQSIEERSKGLQAINDQIRNTQKQLDETQTQKNTLFRSLKKIDYTISQLNLSIKSGQITVEKYGLELQSLQYDIDKLKNEIEIKRLEITKLFKELYQKSRETLLVTFLKNRSLAQAISENQNIANLNNGLSTELGELKELRLQLDENFHSVSAKKVGIERENLNLRNRKNIVETTKSDRQSILSQTKNQEKLYASLIDSLAKKQADISAEIETIEKELRSKIDPSLLPIPRPGVLAMPVSGILSQNYGYTAFAKYGYKGRFHNGVDFAAPTGTEVRVADSGTVIATGNQDQFCYRGAYGKFIVVQHENNLTTLYAHRLPGEVGEKKRQENNLTTLYAHLSGQAVKKGDIVNRGQLIGYVGSTGYATGPHLHLTVYAGPTFYMGASRVCGPMPFGGDLDPSKYL